MPACKRTLVPAIAVVFNFTALPVNGQIVYVDADAPGQHDGTTWCTAYAEVHAALDAAGAGTTIRVADGTYTPGTAGLVDPREATFQLVSGVTLEGGYAGCGAPDPDVRDVEVYETVLSADIGVPGDSADNTYHVVTGSGTDETAVVDGFTITDGRADAAAPHDRGAGMYNDGGSPTVLNSILTANYAGYAPVGENRSGDGAGMYNGKASSPALTNCRFFNNHALVSGGGMLSTDGSNPRLSGCTFHGNSTARGSGGGMRIVRGNATLISCTFSENITGGKRAGGGLSARLGGLWLANCRFVGNLAWAGGGVDCYLGHLTAIGCVFEGNTTSGFGGALVSVGTHLTVVNCSFRANRAQNQGGAVFFEGASAAMIVNSRFAENSAAGGGAMSVHGTELMLQNCVLHHNSANQNGGGVFCNKQSAVTVVNCTLAANSAPDGSAFALRSSNQRYPSTLAMANSILWDEGEEVWNDDGSTITFTNSDVRGGWPGVGNIAEDPLFLDPDGVDGVPGTSDDDFRLASGSPCIDAGDNHAVLPDVADLDGDGDTSEPTPFDLEGGPRFLDDGAVPDTGVGDPPIVDMGAYEAPGDCNDNGVPDETEPDTDGDNIIDECDNCPDDANADQADADGDGTGDACEPDFVPTVSAWGLLITALLLLAVAKARFGRQNTESTPT